MHILKKAYVLTLLHTLKDKYMYLLFFILNTPVHINSSIHI